MAKNKKLIVGNWKMNGSGAEGIALAQSLYQKLDTSLLQEVDVVICPPFILCEPVLTVVQGSGIKVGAQTCHHKVRGAYTGEVSAPMLVDCGLEYVILGHSERRTLFDETDELVRQKGQAALESGLKIIICVGETQAQRNAGQALETVLSQIDQSLPSDGHADRIIIAYEPVWAIGSGQIPSSEDIMAMHRSIRDALCVRFQDAGQTIPLLYGGSMNPENAQEILSLAHVDGGLIGGASLSADSFAQIAVYGQHA